ncbi:MAG: tetratricopeptide repeat protein [Acidobacteriota bacterium]
MATRLIVAESGGKVRVGLQREGQILPEATGGAADFQSPLSAEEREQLRWYLEDYLIAPFAVYQEQGAQIQGRLKDWGERLFSAVFSGEDPLRAYSQAMEAESCELWLSSSSAAFLGLPWELLRDPKRPQPLALTLGGINRTVKAEVAASPVSQAVSLRVLMAICRPLGRKDVPYRTVARPLLSRLEPVSGSVRLDVLRPPTFNALKKRIEEARKEGDPYQILHFDGHGAFGELDAGGRPDLRFRQPSPKGYLLFETDSGDKEEVAAEDFAGLLSESGIPLFVFNACRSGTLQADAGPEATVATRLLQSGAAAVVAMSYSVYAVAAAEFMAAFYEALFAGQTVSRAVAAGRLQLRRADRRPSPKGDLPLEDWIVPVHYARREVSFPGLKRQAERPPRSLEDTLKELRQADRAAVAASEAEDPLAAAGGRFVGRDAEFHELERALRLRRVAVIHGVGGTGKTELAKGFARWLRRTGGLDDPGIVLFHSFEPGLPSFGLGGVVGALGLHLFGPGFVREFPTPQAKRGAVLELLRRHRILLLWDNFETVHSMPDPAGLTPSLSKEELEEMRSFLNSLIAEGKGGILITSRSKESWLGDAVHRLPLGGLERRDALELAEHLLSGRPRAREKRADAAYDELLETLEGHPLSLRLMLPQLEASTAGALLEALRGEGELPQGAEGEGRLDSLGACVRYSIQHLGEEDRRRLPVLSLFQGVADVDVLGFLSKSDEAPERFRGVEKAAWERTLNVCVEVGLLTGLGGGMYRLHPALPGYLASRWREDAADAFEDERRQARSASIGAHAVLGNWLYQQIQGGAAEVAMRLLALQRRSLSQAALMALEDGRYQDAQAVLQPLNEYWDSAGLMEEARGWVDRCRVLLEGEDGQPPDLESPAGALWLFMTGSQANRARRAGDLDQAESEHDRIRQSFEGATSEAGRRHLATAYHQLGGVAQLRGDLEGAARWYRRSLEINEELGNRPGMSDSYHQLGIVAQDRGDLEGAERWYRRSLEIEEDLGNRPGMASSYHQLGTVAQHRGDLEGAERWYRRSLEIKEELGNRPGMALSYGQLGLLAEKRGNQSEALDWMVRCVALFPEFPHPSTGPGPQHLARLTAQLGWETLERSWRRQTGSPLPGNVRAGVQAIQEKLAEGQS